MKRRARRGRPGRRKSRSYKTKRIKTSSGRSPGRIGFRLS